MVAVKAHKSQLCYKTILLLQFLASESLGWSLFRIRTDESSNGRNEDYQQYKDDDSDDDDTTDD